MKSAVIRLVCLAAVALATVGVRAEKFSAGGISFEGPKGWLSQKPSSSMRKAQFAVKGKDGKTAEVVFFHFGPGAAGGVKANVQRWLGQFKEPADKLKAKISDETIDGTKVTYVTAEDLAALAQATIEETPDLYKRFYATKSFTWGQTMGGSAIEQANRNPILGKISGADGLKTGHTQEAGYGFTGSAEQNGRRLVMVVAGLTTYNGRAEESVKFMNWGFRAWQGKALVKKGRKVGEVQVQGGTSGSVGVIAPRDLSATVPAGTAPEMQGRIVYNGPVPAGFKAGDHIADLVIDSPGLPSQTVPLVAEKDVGEAGFFGRAWRGFWSLFGM